MWQRDCLAHFTPEFVQLASFACQLFLLLFSAFKGEAFNLWFNCFRMSRFDSLKGFTMINHRRGRAVEVCHVGLVSHKLCDQAPSNHPSPAQKRPHNEGNLRLFGLWPIAKYVAILVEFDQRWGWDVQLGGCFALLLGLRRYDRVRLFAMLPQCHRTFFARSMPSWA